MTDIETAWQAISEQRTPGISYTTGDELQSQQLFQLEWIELLLSIVMRGVLLKRMNTAV